MLYSRKKISWLDGVFVKKDFQAVLQAKDSLFQIYDLIQRNDNSSNCENELKN